MVGKYGLGNYFLFTRALRASIDQTLNWDSAFNFASARTESFIGLFPHEFSRLKLWVYKK